MALSTTNPLISPGTLNRLLGSVQFVQFPQLNVTASYLARRGISMRRMTPMTDLIDTMTGYVTSPAPFVHVETTINLLRTQGLAGIWEAQIQLQTTIGDIVVRLDSTVAPVYPLSNCSIMQVDPFLIDGTDPTYTAIVTGIYYINSTLWT